jgi:hypothetical protein
MTPQSVWPQTVTSGTRSTPTAYSIVEAEHRDPSRGIQTGWKTRLWRK